MVNKSVLPQADTSVSISSEGVQLLVAVKHETIYDYPDRKYRLIPKM